VQNDMKLWPFKVISGPGDKPMIMVKYKGAVLAGRDIRHDFDED
jgi:hypothetical protein